MKPETANLVDELRALDRWAADTALRAHFTAPEPRLATYGAQIGSAEAADWAEQANRHGPQLQALDARGRRIERVDFHPHWHALLAALRGSGAMAEPFESGGSWRRAVALFYLHGQVESGSLCPATMTQAAIAVLARHAPALYARFREGLHARGHAADDAPITPGRPLWIGMGMTEKQGGSDLRQVSTVAEPNGERFRVNGHKWFFSAPGSDAHLVLARSAEGPSCLLLPRWRLDDHPDGGGLNGVQIQRLKDKLGNRSNASSEVEFHDSEALLVGEPGRGIAVLAEMAGLTRLQCAVGSAALMRAGLVQALHNARHRQAFGKQLVNQPAMLALLADLALESEAALALVMRIATAFDAGTQATPLERAWQRLLTPAAKLWVCKRAVAHAAECMEALGGNGYVETGSLARLYREAPVNSIWEGSGNVMALDVLRAAQRDPEALDAWCAAQALLLEAPERERLQRLREQLLSPAAEPQARQLASELALLAQAAALAAGMQNGIQIPATIAADFIATRLRQPAALFGASRLGAAELLLQRALPA